MFEGFLSIQRGMRDGAAVSSNCNGKETRMKGLPETPYNGSEAGGGHSPMSITHGCSERLNSSGCTLVNQSCTACYGPICPRPDVW